MENGWNGDNVQADTIWGFSGSAMRMVMLRTANALLELFGFAYPVTPERSEDRPGYHQGITHICIRVSVSGSRIRPALRRRNALQQRAKNIPGLCRAVYGRDPDGKLIELIEPDPLGCFCA